MQALKTIIADDEPLALELLADVVSVHSEIEVIEQCRNGREVLEACAQHQPDLLFLDIQMPGLNGFDVVTRLQVDVTPLIVFVTAYDEFAMQAFDVHAVDYLLKPIDAQKLERAIQRCVQLRRKEDFREQQKQRILAAKVSSQQPQHESAPEKLIVKESGSFTLLEPADIEWIDAAGDYVCIHANGKTHIIRQTMNQIEAELNLRNFARVHRSTMVNLDRIQKIFSHTKGEYFLDLGYDQRIKVSRSYRTVILDFLKTSNMQVL